MDRHSTKGHRDVVFLPEDVNEALWALGVWERMNKEHGTRFDIAEDEELGPNRAQPLADLLDEASDRMSDDAAAIVREAARLLRNVAASGEDVIVEL